MYEFCVHSVFLLGIPPVEIAPCGASSPSELTAYFRWYRKSCSDVAGILWISLPQARVRCSRDNPRSPIAPKVQRARAVLTPKSALASISSEPVALESSQETRDFPGRRGAETMLIPVSFRYCCRRCSLRLLLDARSVQCTLSSTMISGRNSRACPPAGVSSGSRFPV